MVTALVFLKTFATALNFSLILLALVLILIGRIDTKNRRSNTIKLRLFAGWKRTLTLETLLGEAGT